MGLLDKIRSPGNQPPTEMQGSTERQTNSWPPSYEVAVIEIIRSILQGSHLVLTMTELETRALAWAEIFFNIIPEERLRECYVAAEQNSERRQEDRNFPLRRREIL